VGERVSVSVVVVAVVVVAEKRPTKSHGAHGFPPVNKRGSFVRSSNFASLIYQTDLLRISFPVGRKSLNESSRVVGRVWCCFFFSLVFFYAFHAFDDDSCFYILMLATKRKTVVVRSCWVLLSLLLRFF